MSYSYPDVTCSSPNVTFTNPKVSYKLHNNLGLKVSQLSMSVTIGYCAGKEHHLQINDGRATIKVWFIIFPCVVVWGCCPLQHNIVVIACVMYLNVSCVCRLFIIGPLPADAAANNQNMPKVTLGSVSPDQALQAATAP